LEEEEELLELEKQSGVDHGAGSVSDRMLEEILWMWTANPLHVLCAIPESEEEQVGVDMEAGLDGASGARERGKSEESAHAADEQKGVLH
jgi:hypothetical protein